MKSCATIIIGILLFSLVVGIGNICTAADEWMPPVIIWLEPELPMTAGKPIRLHVEYAVNPNLGIDPAFDTGSYITYFTELRDIEKRFTRETHRIRYQKTNAYYTIMKKYRQPPDSIKDKVSLSYSGEFQVELPDLDTCRFSLCPRVGGGCLPYTSFFMKSGNSVEFYNMKSGSEKFFPPQAPVSEKTEVEQTDPDRLTEEHLRLVLGEPTSLTDLALPDGEVVTERWYKGTDNRSYFGYFHVKIVESPDRDDELVAQHDWVIRYREHLIPGRMVTTCLRDEYYSLRAFEFEYDRHAGGHNRIFKMNGTIEASKTGDSLPFVLETSSNIGNKNTGMPANAMMFLMLCEKVRDLPYDQDHVFTFTNFFPFELNFGGIDSIRYIGLAGDVLHGSQNLLHKFVCEGPGLKTIYFLVDDSHELTGMYGEDKGDRIEITLISKREVIDNWDF